jgi:hypothetical protein
MQLPLLLPTLWSAPVPNPPTARDCIHWPLRFSQVFATGGFDAIVSNPPWVAYAGRAAQPLDPLLRHYYQYVSPAFFGYRTLHGLFADRAALLLKPGGRLGLVLPTSIADLQGYGPARRAHDQLCLPDDQLIDFGDGAFRDVFQPSMALTSTRRAQLLTRLPEAEWRLRRNDLSGMQAGMLGKLASRRVLPKEMFGERGYQTRPADKVHIVASPGEGRVPIREGADVEELWRKPLRRYVDPTKLIGMFRDHQAWSEVSVLVRQTARYPIAAVSDGAPFRNSLLAAFATTRWPAHALAAYLNATPIRWYHFHTFRDARQGMPQVKIGHLRRVPDVDDDHVIGELDRLGQRLSDSARTLIDAERAELDALVARGLELDDDALTEMTRWYAAMHAG